MLHEGMRLSRRHQRLLYASVAALFVSGVAWLVFHHFVHVNGDFGPTAHPLEPWCLKVHGAVALIFVAILGSLVRGHIRLGWRMGVNRPSGSTVLAANAFLIASGWALYYIGGEPLRAWTSVGHWVVGVVLPAVIAVHIWCGRSTRRRALLKASTVTQGESR
jgi:hypothetical protein